eukprot:CAMPEP_0174237462 /NCGR_PEP_ID=MMETSP0417-20130205/8382_1 /TAXON_ID=242541 /ORGANISM="Mayorella sp, Strain BSH-02190019" /LENGTH=442 /DNA_ID=CAMNT_0015316219 /DNA_START=1 /DNA_END=1326 /DNA_ORIENTATION=+
MKVKMISRSEVEHTRERKSDLIHKQRNLDPSLHPFERAREYTRALNATKLDKVFAKPFLASLDGHRDGVYCFATNPKSLDTLVSGACDGELRIWSLSQRRSLFDVRAHAGFVRGVTIAADGESMFSVGADKMVKMWKLDFGERNERISHSEPLTTWLGERAFNGISHQRGTTTFATCGGPRVDVWSQERSEPINTFEWGSATVDSVAFNNVETHVLASVGSDRNIALYDLRGATPIRKLVMRMRPNCVAWNPMEAFNFTVANEDHNCYTFDMRRLTHALRVHTDHVSSVMSVAYSPTGEEFVTGSYDRTVRIFRTQSNRSREVYYTRRMQRCFSVAFSADAKFVVSGSDDTNIRVWKAEASKKLGVVLPRERAQEQYQDKLKKKFKHLPEIARIRKDRHVPKPILTATKLKRTMKDARTRKDRNQRLHSKPGSVRKERERSK